MAGDLSIMVVRGLGKVRRFKISSSLLIGSGLFFAAFIIASVFVINAYFAQLRENTEIRNHLAALKERETQDQQKISRMQQRVALLEEYIRLLEKPSAKAKPEAYSEPLMVGKKAVATKKIPAAVDTSPDKATGENTALPAITVKTAHVAEKEETQVVDGSEKSPGLPAQEKDPKSAEQVKGPEPERSAVSVGDLRMQRKNTRLIVSFKLAKRAKDAIPLRGYLHMIIVDKNVDPPQVLTFPHEVLKDGIPVNYKRGQLFVIKHFRVVRGRFFLGGTKQSPDSVRVFVYDKDGLLLLDSMLQVKKAA